MLHKSDNSQKITVFQHGEAFSNIPRDSLFFDCDFPGGNLKKVVRMGETEYDIWMSRDGVGETTNTQWFSFAFRNAKVSHTYLFNIVNFTKSASAYDRGQQIVMARENSKIFPSGLKHKWLCIGEDYSYFANSVSPGSTFRSYTLSFRVTMPVDNLVSTDRFFLAPCTPFSLADLRDYCKGIQDKLIRCGFQYQAMRQEMKNIESKRGKNCADTVDSTSTEGGSKPCRKQLHRLRDLSHFVYPPTLNRHVLCQTRCGQDFECWHIFKERRFCTSKSMDSSMKYFIVITARVHPGEVNTSWVCKGLLDALLINSGAHHQIAARELLDHFHFLVFPVLNPDGVSMGKYRGDDTGTDLNRCWRAPCSVAHPTIYWAKKLIKILCGGACSPTDPLSSIVSLLVGDSKPVVSMFFDLHGHSQKKDVFLYGNAARPGGAQVPPQLPPFVANDCECSKKLTKSKVGGVAKIKSVQPANPERLFPHLCAAMFPSRFAFSECTWESSLAYSSEKSGTARVVLSDELRVPLAYTVEISFVTTHECNRAEMCTGEDSTFPPCRNFTVEDYERVGSELLQAIHRYALASSGQDFHEWAAEIASGLGGSPKSKAAAKATFFNLQSTEGVEAAETMLLLLKRRARMDKPRTAKKVLVRPPLHRVRPSPIKIRRFTFGNSAPRFDAKVVSPVRPHTS